MPTAVVHDRRLTSHDASYHGWSTLIRLQSGELMVACSGGRDHHVCAFGKIQLFRSRDNGRSWSEPEVLVDGPLDDRDGGIFETRNGTLIVSAR